MDKGKTVVIERGFYKLGISHPDGSKTDPKWINDGTSNGIVVGICDDENNVNDADLYGVYQMHEVLAKVMELLNINKSADMVEYAEILKSIKDDGVDVCEYCNKHSFACRYCIFNED